MTGTFSKSTFVYLIPELYYCRMTLFLCLLAVELSVDGPGCKDNLAVDDNQYFILATFSKYGSLDGKGFRLNCTEENAEDISVVAVRIGHISTLAYIPSEKSSDSIRQVCSVYIL